jgi:ATP-dependent Lhr-like helicase
MAEHLRRLGDMTAAEITGPMAALLAELESAGRVVTIDLSGTTDPHRWILAEEVELYRAAFPPARATTDEDPRETIVGRFLQTHALIGLADLIARYPLSPAEAIELLERWSAAGKAVRLGRPEDPDAPHWAARENLAELRRATVAVRRRETLAVAPEVFADFLLHRQHVHPGTAGEGPAFVATVLEQLQGLALPVRLWEDEVLPRRVRGYRSAWLDEVLGRGAWLWQARNGVRPDGSHDGQGHPVRLAFFLRDSLIQPEEPRETGALAADAARVLDLLERTGASFVNELARVAGIEPSRVRRALVDLTAHGLVTNDRFDPMRPGGESTLLALAEAASDRRGGHSLRMRTRRSITGQAEGRWSRLSGPPSEGADDRLIGWATVLLDRYGVLTREVVALDAGAPSWGDLASILARAEWRGELRRGYFVEGLSGLQYATDEAASELTRLATHPEPSSPVILVSTVDPANVYGAGAPLDVELLDGGVARLPRIAGHFLAIRDGRPVLIIESHGKRLTGLPWASPADIDSALKLLPSLTGPGRRILKMELYNGSAAAESPVAARLAELGFVRDYPGMAYYAGWPTPAR